MEKAELEKKKKSCFSKFITSRIHLLQWDKPNESRIREIRTYGLMRRGWPQGLPFTLLHDGFCASVGITKINITIVELNMGMAEVHASTMLFVINLRL